jgi:hypothetical protein
MSNKDAFYFPHFCNARHDRKIKRVRKELGLEGYGIFFMVLETLREQTDYMYPVKDLDLLSDEFGTSENKIRAVICNYGLFEVDEDENFFSSKLIMFLQPYLEGKERKKIAGIKGNLIRHGHATKEELNQLNDQDILLLHKDLKDSSQCDRLAIAKKGKERKGEEKKGKDNKLINSTLLISNNLREKLIQFIQFRKEIKKPIKTDRPINAMVNQIGKSFVNEEHLVQCLDYAMDHEYQGVKAEYVKYEPKEKVYRTMEEKRYYQALDLKKKDPDQVSDEWVESKRQDMIKSLEGAI